MGRTFSLKSVLHGFEYHTFDAANVSLLAGKT